jgi:hypothetical protein
LDETSAEVNFNHSGQHDEETYNCQSEEESVVESFKDGVFESGSLVKGFLVGSKAIIYN